MHTSIDDIKYDYALSAAFDALPVFVWISDPVGAIVFYNRTMDDYMGGTGVNRLGWDWQSGVHADDFDRLVVEWTRSLRTGERYEIQARLRRYDGIYRWFLIQAMPIANGWYGTCTDIDEQKNAERAVRESQVHLRRLYDSGLIAIATASTDGRIVDANDAFVRMLGFSPEDVQRGLRWDTITPPEWQASDARAFEDLLSREICATYEKEFIRTDGRRIPVRIGAATVRPMPDLLSVFYAVDISQAKLNELLARLTAEVAAIPATTELNDLLSTVASIAAHTLAATCTIAMPDITGSLRVAALAGGGTYRCSTRIGDLAGDAQQRAFFERTQVRCGNTVSVPMDLGDEVIGIICLESATNGWALNDDMLPLVPVFAAQVAIAVRVRQRLEWQRYIADVLQAGQLPRTLPAIDGYRTSAAYVAGSSEARIGGDWYDLFELADGRVGITMGDVIGSGLAAGVIMGKLRCAMQTAADLGVGVCKMLEAAEYALRRHDRDALASALAAILDPRTGEIEIVSAGHPAPILCSRNDTSLVDLDNEPLLGAIAERSCRSARTITLAPGARLVFYTDGLIEIDRDVIAGERRLMDRCATAAHGDDAARSILGTILAQHESHDDMAAVVLERADFVCRRNDVHVVCSFDATDARSAQAARKELADFMRSSCRDDDDQQVFWAEIVLGEILANVFEHAPGPVEIEIDWNAEKPRLSARDSGPGLVRERPHLPSDALAESGRGLFLIHTFAEDVQLRPRRRGGTELRCVLPLTRR